MSEPYIGEIRMVGFNFAPVGWAFCDGSLLAISQNVALFNLIGTTYGGDGVNTFELPDLRGRIPIHIGTDSFGNQYVSGQAIGSENVALSGRQIAAHTHPFLGSSAAGVTAAPATGSVPAKAASAAEPIYSTNTTTVAMAATDQAGSGVAHDNLMPYVCVNFIIALFGVFPSQN